MIRVPDPARSLGEEAVRPPTPDRNPSRPPAARSLPCIGHSIRDTVHGRRLTENGCLGIGGALLSMEGRGPTQPAQNNGSRGVARQPGAEARRDRRTE